MKKAASGLIAVAVAVSVAGAASAQSTQSYEYQQPTYQAPSYQTPSYQTPSYQQPSFQQPSYQAPSYQTPNFQTPSYQAPTTTYQAPTTTYQAPTTTYQAPQSTGTVVTTPTYQQPQPYFPGQASPTVVYPGQTAPANPAPAKPRGHVPDTDAWTFTLPRYYPAIRACLRNTSVKNPVIANIQERNNRTVMLIGEGGTADYSVCRTGLDGTRVRPGKDERGLPPAFYAPLGSSFTITPDRPFQPVVDTGQRLVGWIVRTTPVRLDVYGGGRGFDGQFIKPVTVNTDAQ